MARPPALCAHCGHDVARGASSCGHCALPLLAWSPVARAEVADRAGILLAAIGLACILAIARALSLGTRAELLAGVALVGLVAAIAWVLWRAQREWQADGGATATTLFGRVTVAAGSSARATSLVAPGQERVRGDVILDASGTDRTALPAALGANAIEIAVGAALVGALARGRIAIESTRRVPWRRVGAVRTEGVGHRAATLTVTLISAPPVAEDALAAFLIGPFCPPEAADYRGAVASPRDRAFAAEGRPSVSLLALVREAFPPDQKPGRVMRRALGHVERTTEERAESRALLAWIAKRTDRAEAWWAIRDALRIALGQRRQAG